jgi:hypothetical protein
MRALDLEAKCPRMKPSALLSACLLAMAFALAGCVLNVGPSSPRPNVMIRASDAPTELTLAPNIQESYVIPRSASINQVNVTGWRTTLEAGFHNAFPSGDAQSGKRLEILEADLSFSPRAVGEGGTAAVSANIRFKARLVGPSGEELGALAGTAQAREAITNVNGTTDNASKAVEAMYELLVAKLATPSAVPEPKHVTAPTRPTPKLAKSQ